MSNVIKRNLTLGINVSDVEKLPKVGRYLAAFLKSVDVDHGPFEINIALSVEPTEASKIGPIEFPAGGDELPQTIEIVYVDGNGEDDEMEGVE